MATTYTTNYHLGKQTDHNDKFNMDVITDNMDIIDAALKENADEIDEILPAISSAEITDTVLDDMVSSTLCGVVSAAILGSQMYGVVRAYMISSSPAVIMQIAEGSDGTRRTRTKAAGIWSAWN